MEIACNAKPLDDSMKVFSAEVLSSGEYFLRFQQLIKAEMAAYHLRYDALIMAEQDEALKICSLP